MGGEFGISDVHTDRGFLGCLEILSDLSIKLAKVQIQPSQFSANSSSDLTYLLQKNILCCCSFLQHSLHTWNKPLPRLQGVTQFFKVFISF